MEKISETKETGHQKLGSRPYHYAFWYTKFLHSIVLPVQPTKFWNNYPIISISKEQILSQTTSFAILKTCMFLYNILHKSNFWSKTIRLIIAGK